MKYYKIIWSLLKIIFTLGLFLFAYKMYIAITENGWRYQQNKTRTSEIYSLKTSSEIHGNFILGIGSIGNEDYYVFYRKTSSGGLIREKIKTSKCVLYEGYNQPKIIEAGEIGYHLKNGDTIETLFIRDDYYSGYTSVYIPKGTITEKININ